MSEQQPKKNRDEKKVPQPEGKKPPSRELDESELDGIAGGQEQGNKGASEERQKTVT